MSLPTINEVVNAFLYGQTSTPANLVSHDQISQRDGYEFILNVTEYMSGPGRFALASRFAVVNAFFESSSFSGELNMSLTEVLSSLELTTGATSLTFQQVLYDDGGADLVERAFIHASTEFELYDHADLRFIIDTHGNKSIEGLQIRPSDDNFDFVGSRLSEIANEYLEPRIDPFAIGETVELSFDFSTVPAPITYTQQQFDADVITAGSWSSIPSESPAEMATDLVDGLWDAGITRFLDGSDRPIFYGSSVGETLRADTYTEEQIPRLFQYIPNGVVLIAGEGDDILSGGANDDHLLGGGGDDHLEGGEGADRLEGGDGDDTLDPIDETKWNDEKSDRSYGGAGFDTYYAGSGDHYYTDTYGSTFDPSVLNFIDILSDSDGAGDIFHFFESVDIPYLAGSANYVSGILTERETSTGHSYFATIGAADFVYYARFQDEYLMFYDGETGLAAFAIEDYKPGDFGLAMAGVENNLNGGDYEDNFNGDSEADTITGRGGDDTLAGHGGDDSISGGDGSDALDGGSGADTLDGGDGSDTLDGGSGADTLHGGAGVDTASYGSATSGVYVHMGHSAQNDGDAAGDVFVSIENLIGSNFDDTLIVVADGARVWGGAGDDALTLAGSGHEAYGETGNDSIYGGFGVDIFDGGDGDDVLFGYEGADELVGGAGDDYAIGGSGDDVIDGGDGHDELHGHDGDDVFFGGSGDDLAFGDGGDDVFALGTGDDFVLGGAGADTFIFAQNDGSLYVGDFAGIEGDVIRFAGTGLTSFAELQSLMSEWNGTTYIEFTAGDSVTLQGVAIASLQTDDFQFVV